MGALSSVTPTAKLATFEHLLQIPEDERFHEVLDGEVTRKGLPSGGHSLGQGNLRDWLSRFHRRPNGAERPGGWWILPEVTVELSPHQVVQPDLAGWRRERMPDAPSGYPLRLRPDWIAEIFTDGDGRRRDGLLKRRLYADHGVPHLWLIDVEKRQLVVLALTPRGYQEVLIAGPGERVRAAPFDALELPVGVLFGDDPE